MGAAAGLGPAAADDRRRPARSRSRHWGWARSGRGRARRARSPPPSSARRSNPEPVQAVVEPPGTRAGARARGASRAARSRCCFSLISASVRVDRPAFDEDELRARRDIGLRRRDRRRRRCRSGSAGPARRRPIGCATGRSRTGADRPRGRGARRAGEADMAAKIVIARAPSPARRVPAHGSAASWIRKLTVITLMPCDRPAVERGRAEAPAVERLPLGGAPEGVAGRRHPLDRGHPAVRRRS